MKQLKLPNRVFLIDTCYKCPMYGDEFGLCQATEDKNDSGAGFYQEREIPKEYDKKTFQVIIPGWCPLEDAEP